MSCLAEEGMSTTSTATVSNATRELSERGFVRVVQGGGRRKDGTGNSNVYVPSMPPPSLSPEEASPAPASLPERSASLSETTEKPLAGGTEEVTARETPISVFRSTERPEHRLRVGHPECVGVQAQRVR